jgi:hypothetical protein
MFRGNVKIKCNVKIRMAQGAVILILFAFCICLSCISSSAVGSGVFYACSDGTMSPGEFDFNKCLNFGTDDILQGTEEITGIDIDGEVSEDPALPDLSGGASDSLVPDGPVDLDEASGDTEFLDFFGKSSKEYIDGTGTLATGISTKAACARVCYDDSVPMRDELDKCMGFISDGRGRCILYPSQDKKRGTTLPGREKSYTLKRPKDGAVSFHTFSKKNLQTLYGPNGGPKQFSGSGHTHDVDCKDPETGAEGLMTGFKFNPRGGDINVAYGCLFNREITRDRQNSTTHGSSGSRHKCGKDYNEFNYMHGHDMNCGNNFIVRWKHRQWSKSMAMDWNCSKQETADPLDCEDLETDGNFDRACNASDMAPYPVRCPANKALTRFGWNGGGKITFTCCPKPAPGMAEAVTSASNTQAAADAAAAIAAGSCKKTGQGRQCQNPRCTEKTTPDSCNSRNCCTWG